MAVNIPTPPGGRTAPGGETPPGGEGVPGGRGAPGGTTTPTAPLGRPPRITLKPLRKRGQQKTVQKVKITPDRGAQIRQAVFSRKQQQEQIKAHVKETMPQFKPAETGKEVPPQTAGMGQKGRAHQAASRTATRARVNTRKAQLKAQNTSAPTAGYHTEMAEYMNKSDSEKELAASNRFTVADDPEAGKRPAYGINPEPIAGETWKEYGERYADAQEAWLAAHPRAVPPPPSGSQAQP